MTGLCPGCGEAVDAAQRAGPFARVCPRCVLQEAVEGLSTPDLDRVGTRLGGYEVVGLLGSGGMGTVYVARQPDLDREVAVKVLARTAGRSDVERFLREARALARLRHPNIVSVHEVGTDEGVPWYAMDLLGGRTLADRVGDLPLEPHEAVRVVLAVARAIAHAHEHGIVHRDLKSSNIVLADGGEPVVVDFGLALDLRQDQQLTRTGVAIGTGPYMAPEQVSRKHGPIGPGTDVYGLGAVLYECLTGAPPFWDDDLWELFRKIQYEPPIPPRDLHPAIERGPAGIALRALEKEPGRRYPSAAAMVEDLDLYLCEGSRAVETRLARTGPGPRDRAHRSFLVLCRVLAYAIPLVAVALLVHGFSAYREEDRRLDTIGRRLALDAIAPALESAASGALGGDTERRLKDEALGERRAIALVLTDDGDPVLSTGLVPDGFLEAVAAEGDPEPVLENDSLTVRRVDLAYALEPGSLKDALRVHVVSPRAPGPWRAWIVLSRRDLWAIRTRTLQNTGFLLALFVLVLVPLSLNRRPGGRFN